MVCFAFSKHYLFVSQLIRVVCGAQTQQQSILTLHLHVGNKYLLKIITNPCSQRNELIRTGALFVGQDIIQKYTAGNITIKMC